MNVIQKNPDKFGFYQLADRRTFSKIEALEWQQKTKQFPEWNFNDSVFGHYNWAQEPVTDLWDLYRQRAQQIRSSYDYCVIFYSGGSDSHNLLNAWIDADCKIDEIATFHYYQGSNDKYSYMNAEVTRVAVPYIEELSKQQKFKYRLIDLSEDVVDLVRHHSTDYKYLITHYLSPNNHAKVLWREKIQDYRNLISQGKSVCFIWGSEKPFMGYDGRHYVQFFDAIDNCSGPTAQNNFINGYYDELFYWTPDMPDIVCKQAHTIKKFCQTIHDPQFYQKTYTRFGVNPVLNQYVSADTIKQILYPTWDPGTFCDGKPRSIVWSDRDHWFFTGNIPEASVYKSITKDLFQNIDPYWLNDPADFSKGLKAHVSRRYYLTS